MKIINTFSVSRFVVALAALCATLSSARTAAANPLDLLWDPIEEHEVVGYIVHVGTQPGTYTYHVDVGPATSWSLTNGAAGQQYCFAVTAYGAEAIQGPNSNEICGFSNAFPRLANPGTQSSLAGERVTLQLAGSDPEGQPVTYNATGLPPGLTLMASTGLIAGTPTTPGDYSVTAIVSDGVLTKWKTFTWVVNAVDLAPLQVGLTANHSAPQNVGTTITLTAAASGGQGQYQYKWWVYDGATWTIVKDWSTGSTFIWQPTMANAAYSVGVWVRNATTTTDMYEAAMLLPFAIAESALQVELTADRPAPQPSWTTITFKAKARGGQGPYEYRWKMFKRGAWVTVQDWSSVKTYTWIPSSAGVVSEVKVTVRSATGETVSAATPYSIVEY